MEKRFERLERLLTQMYDNFIARFDKVDKKLDAIIKYANENRQFQLENRIAFGDLSAAIDRNRDLVEVFRQFHWIDNSSSWFASLDASLQTYYDQFDLGTDWENSQYYKNPDKVGTKPGDWLDLYISVALNRSKAVGAVAKLSTSIGDESGYLTRSIHSRSPIFCQALLKSYLAKLFPNSLPADFLSYVSS